MGIIRNTIRASFQPKIHKKACHNAIKGGTSEAKYKNQPIPDCNKASTPNGKEVTVGKNCVRAVTTRTGICKMM